MHKNNSFNLFMILKPSERHMRHTHRTKQAKPTHTQPLDVCSSPPINVRNSPPIDVHNSPPCR